LPLLLSTDRQGKSGLGLDAQHKAVEDLLNGGRWKLLSEYVEVESGKNDARPRLANAGIGSSQPNCSLSAAFNIRSTRDARTPRTI
jgi:hypothetical protein